MKTAIALLAVALGASMSLGAAKAAEQDRASPVAQTSQATDISAAKRKRQRVYVYPEAPYGYYYHAYPRAFSPGDPSYQSPQMVRLRAANRCIIDLGYGRWEYCN